MREGEMRGSPNAEIEAASPRSSELCRTCGLRVAEDVNREHCLASRHCAEPRATASPPSGRRVAARTIASDSTSAASAPMIVDAGLAVQRPVARANTVSPSPVVCDGLIARARPSSAISATRFISAFVSRALVATTAIVVFSPARGRAAAGERAGAQQHARVGERFAVCACARQPRPRRSRVDDVAGGVDGDDGPDDQAVRRARSLAEPMPAFHRASRARAACRPWRRRRRRRCLPPRRRRTRRWPPCSRSRRSAGSSDRRRTRGRRGPRRARSAPRRPRRRSSRSSAPRDTHDALRRVEAVGAAAGQHDALTVPPG